MASVACVVAFVNGMDMELEGTGCVPHVLHVSRCLIDTQDADWGTNSVDPIAPSHPRLHPDRLPARDHPGL